VSCDRISLQSEKKLQSTIFTVLDRLDLSNHSAVILYIKSAYDAIKQQGYIEGGGDRTLLKALIVVEEQAGTILTRKKIANLQSALDIFERYETILALREHENIYFLVSVYNTIAAGFLDVREADIQLDKLFQENMDVCKLYAYNDIDYLKFFSQSLSRYASDIRLSTSSTADEKMHMLSELVRDMKMLKLLIDKMLNVESEYKKRKGSVPKSPKGEVLSQLQEAILICAADAAKGNPEPVKWFFTLWEHVGEMAKKFVDSNAKKGGVLFSPKLNDIMNKTILKDKLLKSFAEYCTTQAQASIKNNM
jgi:hypothetical protein